MKCLEGYTIKQVKEMSGAELKVLWDRFVDENKVEVVRSELIKALEIIDAKKPIIGN